jgi:hypothetical protein
MVTMSPALSSLAKVARQHHMDTAHVSESDDTKQRLFPFIKIVDANRHR